MSAMAAVGRGSACAAGVQILLLVLASLLTHQAHGVVHTVGGASGWDLGVDYVSWAAGQTFAVGDVLFFPYQQTEHDVVVVSKAGYDSCSAASPIDTYSAGNDNVTLTSAGAHYYLCSVIGHCAAGMKLAVTVAAAAAAPTLAPPPSPTPLSPSPSPASRKTPSPSPIPSSPAATPSSSPAPSPSLAPAPTSPAPSPTAPAPAPAIATPAPSISTPSATPTPGSTPSPPSPPPPPAPPSAASPLFSSLASLALALASLLLAIL